MCKRLTERSLVDRIYISCESQANDKLVKRYLKQKGSKYKNINAEGNTQDMMEYITITEKVCLVVLHYTGLSTNSSDLYEFLKHHPNLEIIIVDRIVVENDVLSYKRSQLLDEPNSLKKV
ncbi:hypothetical protein BDF21DRAFT_408016 [Thamnidium elegans]|nr:hypothetical protein BDF21DRAFT_408016 [Thamnidium elegans]